VRRAGEWHHVAGVYPPCAFLLLVCGWWVALASCAHPRAPSSQSVGAWVHNSVGRVIPPGSCSHPVLHCSLCVCLCVWMHVWSMCLRAELLCRVAIGTRAGVCVHACVRARACAHTVHCTCGQATRLGSVFLDMLCLLPMLVFLIAWHVKATPAKVVQWYVHAWRWTAWCTRRLTHLRGTNRLVTPHISRFGLGLIVYNFIGFLALVAYQYNTVWYLSLSNFRLSAPRPSDSAAFIVPDATRACHEDSACLSPIDWSSVVTLCLHAPLAEELLFRAGLFIVTLRRLVALAGAWLDGLACWWFVT